MQSAADLRSLLNRIDHRGYPAYKDTKGTYRFPGYVLSIDHVQGDPFASPSKVSIHVEGKAAAFPSDLYCGKDQRIALQDELTRQFAKKADQFAFQAKGSGKSGMIAVSRCGQEVLERTACRLDPNSGDIILRMEIGFPANGRTINARELEKILFQFVPECVKASLFYKNADAARLRKIIDLAEDQRYIRDQLPKEQEVTITLPHAGVISGMGIKRGITLIVGGGYHGKSTLLKALETGVYPHVAGDGREYVITDDTAVKIRAEDGRSIKKTDISMFINDLPNGKDTVLFCTEDASGSTSQAANVIESMEAGTSLFLIDEDTSATNFMIRDELMQRVIHREMEPIRELYEKQGISTVIVAGSSGAYFHIADTILQMDRYEPKDITGYAKKEAEAFPAISLSQEPARQPDFKRCPIANADLKGNDRIKMKTMGKEAVMINKEMIDLRYVEQIVDSEQVTALGYCMRYAQKHLMNGKKDLRQVIAEMEKVIEKESLDALCESRSSIACMAMPRAQEIFACFDRYRKLKL